MKSPTFTSVNSNRVRTTIFALLLFTASLYAFGKDVVYIDSSATQTSTRQQFDAAASFYGLTVDVRVVAGGKQDAALLQTLRSPELLAVVVSADALPLLNQEAFTASLKRGKASMPLLITGIDEHTNADVLRRWSLGAVAGSQRSTVARQSGWYAVASGNEVTRQLGGSRLPLVTNDVRYLVLNSNGSAQWLIETRAGTTELPVFVRTEVAGRSVFFAAENGMLDSPATPDPYRQQIVFASLASPLMFLHYAAGEHAWHSPAAYANFTVDDPWLREPYGHVNFEELLQQAQLHNFHATVAFIPWNFDRSQANVVSLFRGHPDRLSICIHGNDHVHQEFGPLDSHPLQRQAEAMKQGLARMERFTALTMIPVDAVMVFPHSVAPQATFVELRRNNYLATANSLNVPSDAAAPAGADYALRTATLQFGAFPSLRRYSAETDIPPAQLAIDAFLGNPMLFYAHESYFAEGIGSFDKTADFVNQLQPGTQWESLGTIAHHLYLEKLRNDGNYEIQAFSAAIQIVNTHHHDAVFLVEKDEDFSQPLTVLVDGKPFPYEKSDSQLRLKLPIHQGGAREVAIRYGNDPGLSNIDIARNSFRTNAIRLLSDFRDNAVSNTSLGRRFIKSYAANGRNWNSAMGFSAGLLMVLLAVWLARRRRKIPGAGGPVLSPSRSA